jgi:predicted ArsR family transcriptional regulator
VRKATVYTSRRLLYTSEMNQDPERLGLIAVLNDDLRRRVYLFIRRASRPVSREEVGKEVGISAKLAAFHLEKLLEHGLLKSHYARPPDRSGPGAGRSAKYYEPSEIEVEVSIPARHYDLLGELLVESVKHQLPGEPAGITAHRVASERGLSLGQEARRQLRRGRMGPERALAVAEDVLYDRGYEPYRPAPGEIRLKNCPFHRLAKQSPDLVCAMNQSFIDGLMQGLENESVEVAFEPSPRECCVTLRDKRRQRKN